MVSALWREVEYPHAIGVVTHGLRAHCPREPICRNASNDGQGASTDAGAPEVNAALVRVESLLDNFHKADLFNGVALIAQDGKIIWSKGWGMADRQQEIPNTSQTIFRIYQTTSQFTAAAILLLEQEGKLKVEGAICTYLDNCPAAWQPVTIHHLLSHTSGIPNYFDATPSEAYNLTRTGATPDQIVALFRDRPLAFAPGAGYEWSNSNFVLAGLIIERAAGQPYADFVQQRLLDPSRMTHSGYGDPSEAMALGYASSWAKEPMPFAVSALYAAGGLYSTAEDLFRWHEALFGYQLLDETQVQKMLTAYTTNEDGNDLGYGFLMNKIAGQTWAGNGGMFDGYAARIVRYLDNQITVVLLSNQDGEIFTIAEQIDTLFLQ